MTADLGNPCSLVRQTAEWVTSQSASVSISDDGVAALVDGLSPTQVEDLFTLKAFDADLHYCDVDDPELTAQYLLVVDTINFCFWPDEELEYAQLAGGIKASVLLDPGVLAASSLAQLTEDGLQKLMRWPRRPPLAAERAALLNQMGAALLALYGGSAASLVRAAQGSAARLVSLVTTTIPGFQDQAEYRGRTVYFYKRAQIFCGDVFGAFQGQGLGAFHDIEQLTMFADYRVPAVLRELGVLCYAEQLESRIDGREELAAGCPEEVELRAATVVAVERIKSAVQARRGGGCAAPRSVAIDWWLWEMGEAQRAQHRPHHRTLTTNY